MRPTLRRTLTFVTTGLFVGVLASCQFLVTSDVPAYQCSGTDLSSCPKGQYCKGAGCVACEEFDICDGYDNDCNGKPDDGRLSDADEDGFTICGRIDEGGARVDVDCDDNAKEIRPGGEETCNGRDDNCNGEVDEGTCPGATCAPKRLQLSKDPCIANPCTDPRYKCSVGNQCDPDTLECVGPPVAKLGEPCRATGECAAGLFCAGADVLTARVAGTGLVCTHTCCRSEDCTEPGSVCYASGRGSFCVLATRLSRPVGTKSGGTMAAAATECRSGLLANGRCVDTCCASNQCAAGTQCMGTRVDDQDALGCIPNNGSSGQNATCSNAGTCSAGVCWDTTGSGNRCIMPCCGSSTCGVLQVPLLGALPARCFHEQTTNDDYVPLCSSAPVLGIGPKAPGEPCTDGADCRSGRCYGTYCTDVCCTDTDCANGLKCRPTDVSGVKLLRCVKS